MIFGRQFVKRFAICYPAFVCTVLSECPICLSVMLVYCGQTVGWIKMTLGTEVGIGPGHIVLDGDSASQKGAQGGMHSSPAHFSAHMCCGQTAVWIKIILDTEVGLSAGNVVLDGDPVTGTQPPIFDPCLLWPNGWIDQDAIWYGGRPRPERHCIRWKPSSSQKGNPNFWPMSVVAKRRDGSRCHLVRR